MNRPKYLPGVIFYEEDKEKGPFKLRISGTNNFVTKIDLNYYGRFGGPGIEKVSICSGWDNSKILLYKTMDTAIEAANHVHRIEGFHISIEIPTPVKKYREKT